ncbi:ABC transporter ATP-binding protein [Leptolyngbya sp. NIES-2104]|uniref:ABC transporter ATP-binding protein n=1 Tax=Leptolyngbya sp. NIES-2104 TaxID=1552121 RepID=UPI0006EC8A88|nr:ABC transporter ATP-binding protein [Leptolyngbya sp. NIES-2104]GAP94692.1 phospholipid-lipopolysaccharide ABC transporter [Leptolyngbya sp. NIES-2104]
MINYLNKFFYILGDAKKRLLLLVVVFVLSSLLETFGIGLIGPFLWLSSNPDAVRSIPVIEKAYEISGFQSTQQFIPVLGIALAITFIIKSLLYFFARHHISKFGLDQQARVILRLLSAYLSAPYTFHLSRDSAGLINTLVQETQNFCHRCTLPLLEGLSSLITATFLVLLLAKTSSILFVMILAIVLPTFLLFYIFKKKAKRWGREVTESTHGMIRVINHSLGGVKETYAIGCKPYFMEQMREQAFKNADSVTKTFSMQVIPKVSIETLMVSFVVLLVSVYPILFGQKVETILPILSIFAVASMRLIPAASQSLTAFAIIQTSGYTLDIIYSDLKTLERSNGISTDGKLNLDGQNGAQSGYKPSMTFTESVELKQVTYSYPNTTTPSIKDISFRIGKGQSIALIGKSGAGKTTLVDVVLGLLEPTSGDLLVDGISIYKNIQSWRNLIGYIPQSIFLMDDTVEKNIAFGVPDHLIDKQKIDKVIQMAQLTDLIDHLPDGLETFVGERGVRLSGGQRQRIGIARALYHDSEILILDEATAALDNETEKLVSESIQHLSGIKTLIIIAHRLSTVEHCDQIYVLEGGKLVRSGSYREIVLNR